MWFDEFVVLLLNIGIILFVVLFGYWLLKRKQEIRENFIKRISKQIKKMKKKK